MPGVVDEDVEAARGGDRRPRAARDRGVVEHVDLDEAAAELLGRGFAAPRVAGADPDLVAGLDQPPRRLAAEALVGAGDQDAARGGVGGSGGVAALFAHAPIVRLAPRRHKRTGAPWE